MANFEHLPADMKFIITLQDSRKQYSSYFSGFKDDTKKEFRYSAHSIHAIRMTEAVAEERCALLNAKFRVKARVEEAR